MKLCGLYKTVNCSTAALLFKIEQKAYHYLEKEGEGWRMREGGVFWKDE